MLSTKPVGRGASARKYDLLTALGTHALAQGKHDQRRILRLMTLITARYNWARDELTIGQAEIARLWSVDARTVKREIATLRGKGWLVIKRAGARGRVATYGLALDVMWRDTAAEWANVGPDFEVRVALSDPQQDATVVPLRGNSHVPPPEPSDGSEWSVARSLLHSDDAGLYASWIAGLERAERVGGILTLRAPSRFHAAYIQTHLERRVLAACQDVDADVSELRIIT